MDKIILLHLENENKIYKMSELIEEAKRQEKDGIKPHYSFFDYKKKENITPKGWLVFSTWADGCGVVYKMPETNSYKLVTGWQGDFCYN